MCVCMSLWVLDVNCRFSHWLCFLFCPWFPLCIPRPSLSGIVSSSPSFRRLSPVHCFPDVARRGRELRHGQRHRAVAVLVWPCDRRPTADRVTVAGFVSLTAQPSCVDNNENNKKDFFPLIIIHPLRSKAETRFDPWPKKAIESRERGWTGSATDGNVEGRVTLSALTRLTKSAGSAGRGRWFSLFFFPSISPLFLFFFSISPSFLLFLITPILSFSSRLHPSFFPSLPH